MCVLTILFYIYILYFFWIHLYKTLAYTECVLLTHSTCRPSCYYVNYIRSRRWLNTSVLNCRLYVTFICDVCIAAFSAWVNSQQSQCIRLYTYVLQCSKELDRRGPCHRVDGPSWRSSTDACLVYDAVNSTRARQHRPCWRVMKTGHPSTRAVSGNRGL